MEQHFQTIIERHFGASQGELLIGACRAGDLARMYGTPFFAYDARIAEKKWAELKEALPARFSICYSIKANPSPAFLHLFLSKGCGLEVASAGELYQALSAGCPPEKILFAGPGKTEAELEFALSKNIGEIHAESLTEIGRISGISRKLGRRARISVRVNPTGDAQGGAMRMGGKPAPFGIDEEQLDEVLDRIASDAALEFRGVHLFTGTQILDAGILLNQYRRGLEIARGAAARTHLRIATLDFGGGLGIPYFQNEHELNLVEVSAGLKDLMNSLDSEACFQSTRFFVEPGRFLSGECGIYLARINDIKVSRGKKFLITDGGMHHHLAASGNLGQTIKRNYPVALVNRLDAAADEAVDVVGPLCTPLDVLARGVTLPKAEIGDLIGIFQSGAYARAASPLGFLSQPTPPEVWVDGAHHFLIRRRGTVEDLLLDV
ncbi:MAG: type III PLP-dependent enzyme, partial [Candidatus Acidiferrum sp.]